ncbi:glycosyltransferase family 2 protein [Caloranaerobacter azorensis]|uniref:Glycosyltransferase family 2 protein n=1 Tax=Caloranaerobacter azorensis TaxID=116090 RepID=A0A6P1YBD9_9FIRM|nr:glycosyltransferase family 2 protein [Caloranaerobacter azorensis]QIB26023.1 glycosyltransferase family 2 protein [Caloranaerobacter azorensis]
MSIEKRVIAVIPVYNEADRIHDTVVSLKKISLINKIIVVDDGSNDGTVEKIKDLDIDIIILDKNYGKGHAIKVAIQAVDFDYLVLVDGDLGFSAIEISKLINPVIENKADFTIARFVNSKKGGFGLVKNLAKFGVYFFTGKMINTSLSGQRVYKKEVINDISYIPSNYGIEVAMTIGALNKGYRLLEVDVDMFHRETGRDLSGFIHRGKQFLDILFTLLVLLVRR